MLCSTLGVVAFGVGLLAPGPGTELAALAGAIAVGELVTLRLHDGTSLPTSLAVMCVVVRVATWWQALAVTAAGQVLALAGVSGRPVRRASAAIERVAMAAAAAGAFRWATRSDSAAALTAGLLAAGAAALAVLAAARHVRREQPLAVVGGASAAFALVSAGILMALGHAGAGGGSPMGLWSVPLFAVLVLAARYSFARRHEIGQVYEQTIRALGAVPELGGLAAPGRAERVASLSVTVGRAAGLSARELTDLERAALLHELGRVMLDGPGREAAPVHRTEVARATAEMLRQAEGLDRPADLLAAMAAGVGAAGPDDGSRLAAGVLMAATEFDEVAAGDLARAGPALRRLSSVAGHDSRALAALRSVVAGNGLVVSG